MSLEIPKGSEPDPNCGPVREFLSGQPAHFDTLADLRDGMVLDDIDVIDAVASRLRKTREAVLFKANPAEGIAPQQQIKNLERVTRLAAEFHPDLVDTLPDLIGHLYEIVIPTMVADQQTMFPRTRLIDGQDNLDLPEQWEPWRFDRSLNWIDIDVDALRAATAA